MRSQLCFFAATVATMAAWFAASLQADQPFQVYSGKGDLAPKQPQAFVDPEGAVHLVFGVGNSIYYSKCSGVSFDAPTVAFDVPNLSLGMRRGPRIAASAKAILVTAIGGAMGKGRDGDLLAYRSEDAGKTWLGPVRVNDTEASAREGLHAMTITSQGVLWCVWLDLRSKKTELYASKSEDHGHSWSRNQLIYRSPDGSVCECCHPSIATFGESIHVLFRNSLGGNRDMYLVSSNDNGKTFGKAKQLGLGTWQLNACPMDGGMLAIKSSGEVVTAWRRQAMIYTAEQFSSAESPLAVGEQPWVAANAQASYVVWTDSRPGSLMFSRLGSTQPERLTNSARDPVIVAAADGSSRVHLFWERVDAGQTSIMWLSKH